ncbi:MAG: HAMP domain-containing protein [Treponema sp.]|jgi:adenylate cyclase|nr:HAMP domain-containing protein [Treponema sp.]
MGDSAKTGDPSKMRFPIGGKLVIIITLLLLLSLVSITVLVWVLVSADVRTTAEDNNRMVNRRSGVEVETALKTIRSDTLTLLSILNALPKEDLIQEAVRFFFEQNQHIAALGIRPSTGGDGAAPLFINERFFHAKELEPALIPPFLEAQGETVSRVSAGTDTLLNGTPDFGVPMLVMFFPWVQGETRTVVIICFSTESITENFGTGANVSFMINDAGAVLVHPDQELVRSGANMQEDPFVHIALDREDRSFHTHYTDEEGVTYFGAVQKLALADAVVLTRIPAAVVFEGIIATTRRNLYLSIAVLSMAVLFVWFFSKTISTPLKTLKAAAEQIEAGDYHLDLNSKSADETGVLTQSFLSMSLGLANFEKFTNQGIVQLARKGKLTLGGVSKTATVCFALIRDFSEIAEGLHAKEVVGFINEYMDRMVPCITRTGGVVDKFLTQGGVIIMALWGTVESAGSPEQDALNCVKAVLMMRASLGSLNQERGGDRESRIKMGCGINTGEVVSGQMGSEERMEYTVIGDTVNLAARIEGPNDLFDTDILLTENTYDLIGHYLLTEEMPGIEVKGKEKPVRVFAVINMHDPDEAIQLLDNLDQIPKTDRTINRQYVGPHGPRTLAEVRERW